MKYYVEITLIDGDKSLYELWSMLYGQVHFVLASMHNKDIKTIGVSFPNYRFLQKNGKTFASLGDKLRIFADSQELMGIFAADLQNRLNDHVKNWDDCLHFKSIKAVPENHTHAIFSRYSPDVSKENLARRYVKRHNEVTYDEALARLADYVPQPIINYPFITLKSQSTGEDFNLRIAKKTVETAVSGEFGAYGLGGGSVPDF